MSNQMNYVKWFRDSAPYINANRGKTLVLVVSGEAVEGESFRDIVHDIALLDSLGARLVIVHGARAQITQRLQAAGIENKLHDGLRITHEQALPCVIDAVCTVRTTIESQLSMGLPNSPMHGAQ